MLEIDLYLSKFFFNFGSQLPKWLVIFLSAYLIWALILSVLVYIYLANKKKPTHLFFIFILSALATKGINFVISWMYFRTRPFVGLGLEPIIAVSEITKSFPSDHSAFAWTLAGLIFFDNKKTGFIFLCIAGLISLGRVLASVHYLSDVVAGAAIGLLFAWLVNSVIIPFYFTKRNKSVSVNKQQDEGR